MTSIDVTAQYPDDLVSRSSSQQQTAEAIAQLADGVAHDFNNLLTIVMVNLGFLEDAPGLPSDYQQATHAALGAAQRGSQLTERLRAFCQADELRPKAVDATELLRDIKQDFEADLPDGFEVEISVG